MQQDVYEIYDHKDRVVGKVWWDPQESKVDGDNPALLRTIKTMSYNELTVLDGPKFLKKLEQMFRSGYTYAKRAEGQ